MYVVVAMMEQIGWIC